ncbi:MAG: glycerate-2-kinase family protein, partial [Acidobacteriota bacterium]
MAPWSEDAVLRDDTGLRADARAILDAAVAAVEPEALVFDALRGAGLGADGSTFVVAVGKAAPAMARGARRALGDRLSGGCVVGPKELVGDVAAPFSAYGGGHPVPKAEGVRGAEAIRDLAAGLGPEDTLYVLISGGGSALMTLPPPAISLPDVQATTQLLLRAGATIQELNAVRKHLDQLKGGRLARTAAPARVEALALSDVVGDPLDVIASGPVSPDPTSFAEVEATLRRYDLWRQLPPKVRSHFEKGLAGDEDESPSPGDPCFDRVRARILGSNRGAASAALDEAERRGYSTLLLTTELVGEARQAGGFLAAIAREVRRSGRP